MALYDFTSVAGYPPLPDFRSDTSSTALNQDNPASPDLASAFALAAEAMAIGGADVEVFIRTDNSDYNKTYDEDPNPTYFAPVFMKAYAPRQPLQKTMIKFGLDIKSDMKFTFFMPHLVTQFGGRQLREGDVIKSDYNAGDDLNLWRIVNTSPMGNYRYQWLYLECTVSLLTADITVMPSGQWEVRPNAVRGD